jgi:arylsulfatase A
MEGYSAVLAVDEAIDWMKAKRDRDKPFFLAVWAHEPHYPIKSDPKYKALYPDLDDDVQREHHANVTQLDDAFGRLMRSLDDQQLSENTFVFFTSDNGPEGDGIKTPGRGSTGGLRGRKRDMHEGGIRVPGLARWPGKIPAGTTVDVPVIGSDIFPTMLATAGVAVPNDRVLDGVDVRGALDGSSSSVRREQPLYWRLQMAPNKKVAMQIDDWKILADPEMTEFELYDLKSDPNETTDMKGREPARFEELRTRLVRHHREVENEGPDWWKRLSPNGGKEGPDPPLNRRNPKAD